MADQQQIGLRVGNTLTNSLNYAAQRGIDITTDEGYAELQTIAMVIVELGNYLTAEIGGQASTSGVAAVKDMFPGTTEVQQSAANIEVAGAQHGPLPEWLIAACAKNSVTKVYDNRDTANATNNRPWFKAADGSMNAKGQPFAFWPPK
jgi:hypothetical protein